MNRAEILQRYDKLAVGADRAFRKTREDYGDLITCTSGCSDCCHAVFGLFLVEAITLKTAFDRLPRKTRRAVLLRGEKAAAKLRKIGRGQAEDGAPKTGNPDALAVSRIRCPLLDDDRECLLYRHRPITCRVYGVPTIVNGKARACGLSGFKGDIKYPAFDLDKAYRELYQLSLEILVDGGIADHERASLLIAVPWVLATPVEGLITGTPQGPDEDA